MLVIAIKARFEAPREQKKASVNGTSSSSSSTLNFFSLQLSN